VSGVGSNVKFSAEINVSVVEDDRGMDFSEEDVLRAGFRNEKKPIFLCWLIGNLEIDVKQSSTTIHLFKIRLMAC